MIFVDTDVWIDFLAGVEPSASAVEALLTQRRALVSSITAFELYCGVGRGGRADQIESLLRVVPTVDLSPTAARLAAHHYTRLRRAGSPIGNQDLLLSGTALQFQIPILTRNRKHFERIQELEVLSPDEIEP